MSEELCSHLATIETIKHAKRRECDDCVKIGAPWVHLRTCQECGTTLCCDNSPNRHLETGSRSIVLDLKQIQLVDQDTVRFLARCEAEGIKLENCPAYIREWIARARDEK